MEEQLYSMNLQVLSPFEEICFPDTYKEYSDAVEFLLRRKNIVILEDDILNSFKDDAYINEQWELGNQGMGPIQALLPNRYIREAIYPKNNGAKDEGVWGWIDLWSDYTIAQQDELYDLFFVYKLRQTDTMKLDVVLNYFLENNYGGNIKDFLRFLKLAVRVHGKNLIQPDEIDTINEWIAEKEKEPALSGSEETRSKVKVKRNRDDKITVLNQEQTALLIYCLQKNNVILKDELLSNKEAGLAFSILTGYSADTIRQNLSQSELAKTATLKNVEVLEKVLKEMLRFIDHEVKPE